MKTVHLNWLDPEGHAFKVETRNLWKSELEEIGAALKGAGYAQWQPDLFMCAAPEKTKNAPGRIRPALAVVGYAVEHHGETVPVSVFEIDESPSSSSH